MEIDATSMILVNPNSKKNVKIFLPIERRHELENPEVR